ncbi:glycine-rich RNA-binding protein 2, mitochondrial-like [Dioscorea cayenensis subsp. rotundata]|uniref:Glycine-rich RNA-binding protein 2, mitochondrial-like n=1 Tax=Dioscorea cayennensis subsp. rotundata TaxID=55577 RepID=A0AB40BRR0_DIOCR|nr:glycine-rich RNA-binding protein 2, mitochondrial-like [Dioscorea cayenensis subsp. rotundata]XP_039129642.1 glycine-rich RNA-binding protein 2, mitochondrial-like [Dioscorea cayenensis subsp. rotundata]XP_039129643.1 glycine-rich RNA-binding protein 2, mitochondrial-like [Dioscorea cayenensis subsp. rotundata]
MASLRAKSFSQALVLPFRRLLLRESCSKLFVGGLSYDTNESVLKDTFEKFGEVIEVKVICDRNSGKSKGFGFIQFYSESEAMAALHNMNGQSLEGRIIRVHYANKG